LDKNKIDKDNNDNNKINELSTYQSDLAISPIITNYNDAYHADNLNDN